MRTEGLASFVILSLFIVSCVSSSQPLALVDISGEISGVHDQKVDSVAGQDQGRVQGIAQAIPLQFVKNKGQNGRDIAFVALSDGGSFFFSPFGVTIKLVTPDSDSFQTTGVAYTFRGANPDPEIVGLEPGESRVNFLVGKDPSSWYTNVPTYGSIVYRDLYPGIDLEYSGTPDGIKSTFTVAPGSSPDSIVLEYQGISGLSLSEDGTLQIRTPAGNLVESPPVAYQVIDGQIVPNNASFVLLGDGKLASRQNRTTRTTPS